MLAATSRALAPVSQFLAACFRMFFYYPIIFSEILYCSVDAIPTKTLLIVFSILVLALVVVLAIANDRNEAKENEIRNEEDRVRGEQYKRHVADKEASHLRQLKEIETCQDLMVGTILQDIKNDQVHAALITKLSELATLEQVDLAIAQYMKPVATSTSPSQLTYSTISTTIAALPQEFVEKIQQQIDQKVAHAVERESKLLRASSPLSLSPIYSQETRSTSPTSQESVLSMSSVSSTEFTPISSMPNTLSLSGVVAQDIAPVASAMSVLSPSHVSIQETQPLKVPQPKLAIGPIVLLNMAPETAQPQKISMSKIDAVCTSPLEVPSTSSVISELKTLLDQSPIPSQATSDAVDEKQAVTELMAVIKGVTIGPAKYKGLPIQFIAFNVDRLHHAKFSPAVATLQKKINANFWQSAKREEALRAELHVTTLETDGLKSAIEHYLGTFTAMKMNGIPVDLYLAKSNDQSNEEDYDDDLDRFLEEQGEQVVAAVEVATPIATDLVANAAPSTPALSLPSNSVRTQTNVAGAIAEPVNTLPHLSAVEQEAAISSMTGLLTSRFSTEVSLKPPSFPVPAQSHTGTGAKIAKPRPSTSRIEETSETTEVGTYCAICDEMVTIDTRTHAKECHGFCQACHQEVSGEWSNDNFQYRFIYDKHKEQCGATSKPKVEIKSSTTPKPSAGGSMATNSKPPTTPATSEVTKTFVCRHCHEDVVAPLITTREGHQIGNFSAHNVSCSGARTYVKFYCINCGVGVTNSDQFYAEHREACQKQAGMIGNFRAFDVKTGRRIGDSTEGLPPMAPRAMLGGRANAPKVTKPLAKGRGPILGSKASTPMKHTSSEVREPSAPHGREDAPPSPSPVVGWTGNVIKY